MALFSQRNAFLEAAEETIGMKCPFYDHAAAQVTDTRMSEGGDTVRRRRHCESRDHRFTTYERIELFFPAVVKKNGSRVDYDRNKVKDSICLALHKRPISAEVIDEAVAHIEEKLLSHGEKEIGNDRMGELVTRELKRLDKIGYIRFASVYRSLKDLAEFRDMPDGVATTNMRR